MPEPFETRYFLSPALSPRQRAAVEARIRAAGAQLDARLMRSTHFVVAPAKDMARIRRVFAFETVAPYPRVQQ